MILYFQSSCRVRSKAEVGIELVAIRVVRRRFDHRTEGWLLLKYIRENDSGKTELDRIERKECDSL